MRVALAVEGTRGDVYPMLSLAAALTRHGHDSVLCAPPDFSDVAAERGVEFRPIGVSVLAFLQEHAHSIAHGGPALLKSIRRYTIETLDRQFAELPDATADADVMIAAGTQVAAGSVAEAHGIPYRYTLYCPVLVPSSEHGPMLGGCGSPPWRNRALWSIGRAAFNLSFRRPLNRQRRALGLPAVPDLYDHFLSPYPVLASDAELAPVPADARIEVRQVPCLHPITEAALPPKLTSFLEAGPPPVYFGFGSMTDPEPAATTGMLLDCISRLGCRALISEGWAGLGEGSLPEGVMTVGSVSHATLFRRVAAVVHHGGAGTTTTAARAGAPQVIVPHVMDQFYWAHQILRQGIGGPALRRSGLSADQLADAVVAVTDNEWIGARARQLGQRLRAAADCDPVPVFLKGL